MDLGKCKTIKSNTWTSKTLCLVLRRKRENTKSFGFETSHKKAEKGTQLCCRWPSPLCEKTLSGQRPTRECITASNVFAALLHSLAFLGSTTSFWATCGLGQPSASSLGHPGTRLRHPGPQGPLSPSARLTTNRGDLCEFRRQWPALRVLRSPSVDRPWFSGDDMTTGPRPALLQVFPVLKSSPRRRMTSNTWRSLWTKKTSLVSAETGRCGARGRRPRAATPGPPAGATPPAAQVRPHREPGPGTLRGPARPLPTGPRARRPSRARPGSRRARWQGSGGSGAGPAWTRRGPGFLLPADGGAAARASASVPSSPPGDANHPGLPREAPATTPTGFGGRGSPKPSRRARKPDRRPPRRANPEPR